MNPDLIRDQFSNPTNVGEVSDANGSSQSGSFVCGAVLRISLRIDDQKRIVAAKFKTTGCAFLVAACSLLTAKMIDKSTAEAAAFVRSADDDVGLRTIAPEKRHCVELLRGTIIKAITGYSDSVRAEWTGDDALICSCFGISEDQIERAVQEKHLQTVSEVTSATLAGAGCGSCYKLIEDILDDHRVRKIIHSSDT